MNSIDFRSDTVTHPTEEMRAAMAAAEVGDDVLREDPTVNRLQDLAAERMGKEAGLLVTSGTMGNLIAVLAHCGRGDEVILGNLSHTFLFEAGGTAALGGVHPYLLPNQADGTIALDALQGAVRSEDVHFPTSRLIVLENTHNRCGGTVLSTDYMARVGELARRNDLRLHVDGARIFNAAAALNLPAADLVRDADTVTFCLSKALCAPVGSVLCGSKDFIEKARRIRKQLGGGMRQAGILAAAGIVALEKMTGRLVDDHARARRLAQGLAQIPGLQLDTAFPASNMIFLNLGAEIPIDAAEFSARLKNLGVRVGVTGERRFRLVTHYWISDESVEIAIDAFRCVAEGGDQPKVSI
jgi:threonine aldolase